MEGVTIIESSLCTRQGDPLRGLSFFLAHYWIFLNTIMRVPNYIFPSLMNNTHIMGPMNQLICAFDHFLTQLTFVGFKVKMLKCKLWSPSRISPSIKILQGCNLVTKWLTHFGCANGFSGLCHAFFGWSFISRHGVYQWYSCPGTHLGCFGHFVFMCSSLTFLSHMDNTSFLFVVFSYVSMWGHYGSRIMGVFLKPLSKASSSTIDILLWYMPSLYERLCPICFSRELGSGGSVFVFYVLYFW